MTDPQRSTGGDRLAVDPVRLRAEPPILHVPGRNSTKADFFVYRVDGLDVAVKDYAPRGFLIRHLLGRYLIRRECRVYRAAKGVEGIPRFYGRLGRFALALEYVDAEPLSRQRERALDDAFFDRLLALVRGIHDHGIALGDLHHRDVLVDSEGDIHLIDLATSWVLGKRSGPLSRAIFRRLRDVDFVAVARMRARWCGGDVESAPATVSPSAAAWHARGRRVKAFVDRLRGRRRGQA